MKAYVRNRVALLVALAAFGSILSGQATAETFRVLHSFSATSYSPWTNSDGAGPYAALIVSGTTLYGTAVSGGTSDNGTVFAVNIDGTGFTTLHSFPETFGSSLAGNAGTNGDGASPWGGLILSSNTLYGTAHYGGNSFMGLTGGGTVFAIKTDGTGFEAIHSFSGGDGANPSAALIVSGTTLYGTTYGGTVFAVKTDGSGFTVLHEFAPPSYSGTNNDGFFPWAGLVLSGDTLFGTARNGGMSGNGTVFAVKRSGTTFTTLHSFSARTGSPPVNSDGAIPVAPLIASGNTLYGTASVGGSSGYGTIFAVNVDGTGFKVIHAFTGSDGAYPNAGLVLSGTTLYGTAVGSGSWGSGTVFAVNINGTGFMILHAFSAESTNASDGYTNSDGASPTGGLILSGNTLYGTTGSGGKGGNGTLFSLSIPPELSISPTGPNLVLSWPTNFAGFDYTGYKLQSTTNLASPVWTTNLPTPSVVNGQYTVVNPIIGARQFYRLSQ